MNKTQNWAGQTPPWAGHLGIRLLHGIRLRHGQDTMESDFFMYSRTPWSQTPRWILGHLGEILLHGYQDTLESDSKVGVDRRVNIHTAELEKKAVQTLSYY